MKKTIFALLLVVALVAVLAIPAMANTTETEYNPLHCLCGDPSVTDENNPCAKAGHEVIQWTKWEATDSLPEEGYYYLTGNVTLTSRKEVGADKTLAIDLNGCTIKAADSGVSILFEMTSTEGSSTPNANTKLILTDSVGTGKLDYSKCTSEHAPGIFLELGTIDMYGGTITHDGTKDATSGGAGLIIRQGSTAVFNMYGGKFSGGKTTGGNGGGNVQLRAGTFNMYGGTIENGKANNGGNIFLMNFVLNNITPEFNMYGGTIKGGEALTGEIAKGNQCGGNVCIKKGTFNIYGGAMEGGKATKGGCVYVEGGTTFSMSGDSKLTGYSDVVTYSGAAVFVQDNGTVNMSGNAEVSGYTSTGNSAVMLIGNDTLKPTLTMSDNAKITGNKGVANTGGGLDIYNASTVKLSGNAQIIGNTDANGKTVNVYIRTAAGAPFVIGEGGLKNGASIGVTMATPGTFVPADATETDKGYFFSDNSVYGVALSGESLMLEKKVLLNGKDAMILEDAIAAADPAKKDYVQLTAAISRDVTISKDTYLDLAGNNMGTVNVAEGAKLYVFDSTTSDYEVDVTDRDYGVIAEINGDVASDFVNGEKHRYLTLKVDGEGYSFHRFYLAVTHSVLRADYSGLNYKTMFKCNDKVAALVSAYGLNLTVGETVIPVAETTFPGAVAAGENERTTAITGLKSENAADYMTYEQKINAYITVNGETIVSAVKTTSMQNMIESVLTYQWDTLVKAQRNTLRNIYANYNTDQCMDGFKNIHLLQTPEGAALLQIGYAEANINPVQNGTVISVGLAGYGNEGTRLATSVSSNNPLKAICLAVTDLDGGTILLISVDSAAVHNTYAKQIVSEIESKYKVPAGNIMISSNHQHSAPTFTNDDYNKLFVTNIVDAAGAALADRKSVTDMHVQTVEVAENTYNFVRNLQYKKNGTLLDSAMSTDNHDDYNRKDLGLNWLNSSKTYESTADNDVQLLRIAREGVERNIMLVNFQVHPLLYTSSSETEAHADIVGLFRNALSSELDCDVMYFSGAGGNLNPFSGVDTYTKGKDALKKKDQGALMAADVVKAIKKDNWKSAMGDSTDGVKVMTKQFSFDPMLNTVPAWLDETSSLVSGKTEAEILAIIEAKAAEVWDGSKYTWNSNNATTMLNDYGIYSKYHAKYIVERTGKTIADQRYLYQSVLAFGDVAFAVAPYEMFDTNGMQIKSGYEGVTSPYAMTFIATQADLSTGARSSIGSGYIPSALGYANGGYSVDIARYAAGTGEKAVENYLAMLNELKK